MDDGRRTDEHAAPRRRPSALALAGLAAVALVVGVSMAFRLIALDHVPGINGDEAWYGVQAEEALAGRPFAWRTPMGNPLNPLHTGPIFLAHLFGAGPAFWVLRLPSAAAGLLLVGLTYLLVRRTFGREAALIATMLMACLPVNIVYSRLGWDPSESGLADLIVLYLVFRRRWIWAAGAFGGALLIHPTNIFLAPVAAGCAVGVLAAGAADAVQRRRVFLWAAGIGGGLACLGLFVLASPHAPRFAPPLEAIGGRACDLSGWIAFAGLYGQLLSGVTVYRYVVGPLSDSVVAVHDVLFWALVLALLFLGLPRLIRQRNWAALGLLAGLGLGLACFYLVAGLAAITPHQERYALFCVVPSCLAATVLADALRGSRLGGKPWPVCGLALCAVLLTVFHVQYFARMRATGGESHRTYWTGRVEPKLAAVRLILAETPAAGAVTIVAEDWWSYWPIRYLVAQEERVMVICAEKNPGIPLPPGAARTASRIFVVGFAGGPMEQRFAARGVARRSWPIVNYRGDTVMHVWDVSP